MKTVVYSHIQRISFKILKSFFFLGGDNCQIQYSIEMSRRNIFVFTLLSMMHSF